MARGDFTLTILRGLHFLCKPFKKADEKILQKMSSVVLKNAQKTAKILYEDRNPRDTFFSKITVITHAGGGLQNLAYLNCKEAFPYYYERGNRVFEYDVEKDERGDFSLSHSEGVNKEKDEALRNGTFTPMSIEECLQNVLLHNDIIVIFDCKDIDLKEFALFIKNYAKDESALERIIIQVFCEKDVRAVKSVYPFKTLHVCMYAADYEKTAKTCVKHNIGAVSISAKAIKERQGWQIFENNNICVFVYTVNEKTEYEEVKALGLTGVFSDFLLEKGVEE